MRKLIAPACLAIVLLNAPALAQGAAAEALYQQGQTALKAGDLDTACAKFRASDKLDPAVGTELDLGDCEEKRGRIASAWEALHAALGRYPAGDSRVGALERRIKKLEARLPKLVLVLAPSAPKDTTVREGDVTIGTAASFGAPIPFDPGEHHLTVIAPGRPPRDFDITLSEGKTATVPVAPGAADAAPADRPPAPVVQAPPSSGDSPGPWIVGGVGAASLVLGIVTGAIVLAKSGAASSGCSSLSMTCSSDGYSATHLVSTLGPVTTVGLVVGAAGLAAGGVWLGLQRNKSTAHVGIGPIVGGASWRLEGSW